MIVTGTTASSAAEGAQHRAAGRARVGWTIHQLGGRRRATRKDRMLQLATDHGMGQAELHAAVVDEAEQARAEHYHSYGVTR